MYPTKAFGPISIIGAREDVRDGRHVLVVSYHIGTDADLEYELPMREISEEGQFLGWIPDREGMTEGEKELDDAVGDWCAGCEEEHQEQLYQGKL